MRTYVAVAVIHCDGRLGCNCRLWSLVVWCANHGGVALRHVAALTCANSAWSCCVLVVVVVVVVVCVHNVVVAVVVGVCVGADCWC